MKEHFKPSLYIFSIFVFTAVYFSIYGNLIDESIEQMEGKIGSQSITKTILDNLKEAIIIFNDKQIVHVNDNFVSQFNHSIQLFNNDDLISNEEINFKSNSRFLNIKM